VSRELHAACDGSYGAKRAAPADRPDHQVSLRPLGLMAGGPEDHFTDTLWVLVEGDE
jgi:hypothetical protein